ncbi:hypothetical protein [Shimazuella alba]|uniref:Uncharacterized protein n=1 Tax=Shimazuella alba TaxID=2690964 RepID=A0A6I4VP80_9BACL|nr:hypothetical protein [Shimazuella alba]MXQ53379.1 hypothetical protein [Shimazuella alba]
MASKAFWNYAELRPHMGAFPVPEEFSTWYELPNNLEEELRNYLPNGKELEALEWSKFERVLSSALFAAHMTVQYSNPAYHNLRHFVEIVEAGKELLDGYEELTSNRVPRLFSWLSSKSEHATKLISRLYAKRAPKKIDDAIKQAFLFALAFHDCGHSGCTFRSMSTEPEKLFRSEEGMDVSTEYVSMIEADAQAKLLGFNPAARLFISYIIASSTYGVGTEEGKRIGISHIAPKDLFGRFVMLADVCPKSTMSAAAFDGSAVNVAETPATGKSKNFEALVNGQSGFYGYIESNMDKVDEQAGVPLTQYLGWRRALSNSKSRVTSIGTSTMEGAVNGAIFESVYRSFAE